VMQCVAACCSVDGYRSRPALRVAACLQCVCRDMYMCMYVAVAHIHRRGIVLYRLYPK